MSKDVVIAGVIVAACLGLVTVAFVVPKQKAKEPEVAKVDDPLPTTPTIPANDPFAQTTPNDPLIGGNPTTPTFPPIADNPFAPKTGNTPGYPNGTKPNPLGNNPFPPITPPPALPIEPVKPPEISEAKSHVVASGETLGEISAKYYGTAKNWKKIAEANKVDPSDLKVGQKLTIPALEPVVATNPTTPDLVGGERSYTIQKGDSFYSIAKKELGNAARWKEIEKLNNGISSDDLQVGKVIKLPAKAAAVEPLAPGPEAPSASDPGVHVVASGETLSDISKKHYGTTTKWKEIVKANPGVDPEGLKVGQKLKIPEIAGTTPAPSTGSTGAPADNPAATYTVKAGEYLEDIAQSQLGSRGAWKKIVDANPGIDPKKLRVGQKLVIPGKTPPPAPEPKPVTTPPPFGAQPGFGQPSGSNFGSPGSSGNFGTPSSSGGNFGSPSSSGNFGSPSSSGGNFGSPSSSIPGGYPAPVGTPPSSPGSTSAPSSSSNPFELPPSTGTRPVP